MKCSQHFLCEFWTIFYSLVIINVRLKYKNCLKSLHCDACLSTLIFILELINYTGKYATNLKKNTPLLARNDVSAILNSHLNNRKVLF